MICPPRSPSGRTAHAQEQTGRHRARRRTFAATAVSLVLGAPSATAALSNNWYAAAPYLMPQSNNPPDPVTVMNATGLKAFQLAFILAPNGGGCSPTWDGTSAVSSDTAVAGV